MAPSQQGSSCLKLSTGGLEAPRSQTTSDRWICCPPGPKTRVVDLPHDPLPLTPAATIASVRGLGEIAGRGAGVSTACGLSGLRPGRFREGRFLDTTALPL